MVQSKISYFPLVCAVASLFATTSARAEQFEETTLPEVTVRAKSANTGSELLLGGSQEIFTTNTDSLHQDLNAVRSVSLGQSIEKSAGVQNNSFGPSNGLPQIRSLTGPRVQITENGLGVSGLAAVSGNLPTAIEPFLADKIHVYKSSAAVLFGGNAIGGAVNVQTNLIPHTLPDRDITGKAEISGGYNTPHNQLFGLTGRAGNVAWHLNGLNSRISGYRVPKDSKVAACYDREELRDGKNSVLVHACQVEVKTEEFFDKRGWKWVNPNYLKDGDKFLKEWEVTLGDVYSNSVRKPGWMVDNPEYVSGVEGKGSRFIGIQDITPTQSGKMTNSHFQRQNASAGAGYISDNGSYAGIGVSRFLTRYGVPGYASLATWTNYKNRLEPVNIKSDQTRFALESMYKVEDSALDNIKTQMAYTKAVNEEYLGDTFANSLNSRQWQGRLEANYRWNQALRGSIGLDLMNRRIDGKGEDRYLPNNRTRKYAIFALQNFSWKSLGLNLGLRHEKVKNSVNFNGYIAGQGQAEIEKRFSKRNSDFSLNNGFTEIKWKPNSMVNLSARYSQSQRAPEVNELYASNRHFAILVDEHGSPHLRPETAKTVELGGEFRWQDTGLSANYYRTAFKDYLYLGATGISNAGLQRKEWRQGDTRVHGFEVELNQTFDLSQYGSLDARLFADWVKNSPIEKRRDADPKNTGDWEKYIRWYYDGDYMPNMPTSRYGLGLSWNKGAWKVGSSITRYTKQKYLSGSPSRREIRLKGYNLWDAYVSYTHQLKKHSTLEWFLDGRNLSNADARPNNSTLKYLTPLPARSVRTGVRMTF
ncbi:TonB-dependent receptor [Neisseria weaveri]|uniref:TonB-dependent receptor n=1 Tax=Neisseria weaveri TaxID=28091 RepID=UPI000D2F9441|nr:TonB-dependent receptor [Neisseria weaveri]